MVVKFVCIKHCKSTIIFYVSQNQNHTIMKNLFYFLVIFCFVLGCNQSSNDDKLNELQSELNKATESINVEQSTKTFIENYLRDIQSQDWKNKITSYMDGSEEFIVEHEKFRTAFSDYKIRIKHLAIDGNEAIMWGIVSAVHSGKFDGNETKGTEATGKSVEWDEVWQFDVVDGKFGDKFDFMDNGISRMKQLGIKCLPED